MTIKKKVIFLVTSLLIVLTAAIITNVTINFRHFGIQSAIEKANSIAESVRDGLTAHMVNNTMDRRALFLENMIRHQKVEDLKVLRSTKVIEQFGPGNYTIYEYDDIEKEVMHRGKSISKLTEHFDKASMRVTIPYIATKYSSPNCLQCHSNAKEGDVLGVISMNIDITNVKTTGQNIILRVIAISLVFLLIIMAVARYFIRPYIKLFDDLEEGISRAYRGDYSHQVITRLACDAGKVATRLNELSDIFRFKKTIELDPDKESIYQRIAYILSEHFQIKALSLMEINIKEKSKLLIYQNDYTHFPPGLSDPDASTCRAFRIGAAVDSAEFHKVCETCYSNRSESLCLPYTISDTHALVVNIRAEERAELERIKGLIPIISNYIQLASPVIQSKMLMHLLQESSLQDPLTGLYNRRFMDNYIEMHLDDDSRMFTAMMIDIDFFKQVNDTHGHDIGDEVIKRLAQVLTKHIKGSDIAIRYGGEEFLILLFDASAENSAHIADELRLDFSRQLFKSDTDNFKKTISVGIANHPLHASSSAQTIKYADVALYNAKNSGRNRVVIFKPHMHASDEF